LIERGCKVLLWSHRKGGCEGGEFGGGGEKIMGEEGEGVERSERDLRPPDMIRGCPWEYFHIIFMV